MLFMDTFIGFILNEFFQQMYLRDRPDRVNRPERRLMSVNRMKRGPFKWLFLRGMKRNILLVCLLMVVCAAGVTALQLYFTNQRYKEETAAFDRDVNAALYEAVEEAFDQKSREVAQRFRGWLEDTAFVSIAANWDQSAQKTVFTLRELERDPKQAVFSLRISIEGYNDPSDYKRPVAKTALVNHLSDQVEKTIRSGTVSFYTQQLGDSLEKYFFETPLDLQILEITYKTILQKRGIELPFTFYTTKIGTSHALYWTRPFTISARRSGPAYTIRAAFADPANHLLSQLKWVLVSSLILVAIILFCFYYTVRTLLSQQRLARMKDDFISNMSHELHTPLCSISITAEALRTFRHDREAQESYLDIILHQSRKLTGLTDELITAARLEQTAMALTDLIDLNVLIREVTAAFPAKSGVLTVLPADEGIFLKGNALHLAGALENLIDNALKYNSSGNREVVVACGVNSGKRWVSVTDNGPGIPPGERERIFAQFYRISAENSQEVRGYGLGLSYVKKVVAAHKGTIAVRDAPQGGSTFMIQFQR
jgi:two-component system phosphate regulon sensor histidine kinase PhoR